MNEVEIKKYLNEYFSYIKAVFLRDYSKYLCIEKIEQIKNMTDVFKIDTISKYKIFITDKINICTNIDSFIMDNNLNNDRDLKDISIDGRIYVKYLTDNRNNSMKIILETIIKPIIQYFVGKTNSVIEIGTIDIVIDDLVRKYNLKNMKPYNSKEATVALKLKDIVTEQVLFRAVLNNNMKLIRNKYEEYIDEQIYLMEFDTLLKETEKEYNYYYKRIGKVFYSDTLYDYENINYNEIISELDKINSFHNNDINTKKCRFNSAKKCIQSIKEHMIMFDNHEQFLLNNYSIEIDNMISKINVSNVDDYYLRLEKIENDLLPLSMKIWSKQVTYPLSYIEKDTFMFLIGSYPIGEYTDTRLISDKQLMNVNCKIKNCGFIYRINNNIVYSSTKNFLYTKDVNNEIDIDDKKDSKLLTPKMIIDDNLRSKNLSGKILLKNALPCGVYVYCENELTSDYVKALELSQKYELPLIKLDKNYYKCSESILDQPEQVVIQKEIVPEKKKNKISLAEKFKKFNKKMIYDEEIEEFRKVL